VKKPEAFPNRRQHSQGQTVHLQNAQRIDVVLVPLDERAVGHGRVLDGHHLAQRSAGHDEPAHVLREMPWEADDLLDQPAQAAHRAIVRIEAGLTQALFGQ